MARLTSIKIKGYRSLKEECRLVLPHGVPLVLIGENNAGKSNVIRALEIVLGEMWPSSREPDDHDFWGRSRDEGIEIEVYWTGLESPRGEVESYEWSYHSGESEPCTFMARTIDGDWFRPRKELREQCLSVVISADRRLSYQLSYTSKWTLLSKLMRRFHKHLVSDPERVERLKEQFEGLKEIFEGVSEFKVFQEGLVEQLGDMLEGMSYGLSVDFSAYDPSNFFHSLRVLPNEWGESRNFDELGTGQEQLLALVFAHAYAKAFYGGIVLVIEEPEAHLHPLAQKWLALKIREMAADGLQVILTTHSPAFVDVLGLEGVVLVRKLDDATVCRQITAQQLADFCELNGAARSNEETVLPFYANSATESILGGLFARKIVLVEGHTEELALPIYLRRMGLDILKEGIAVIPVLGKGNLAKWWRFFRAFGLPVYVIFDNDSEEDRNGRKRRDALQAIGLATDEISALLATDDWVIEDACTVFGGDFECTLRDNFWSYEGLEQEGIKELGNDSKPLIAKYVAERLELDVEDDARAKLKRLAHKIRRLPEPEDWAGAD